MGRPVILVCQGLGAFLERRTKTRTNTRAVLGKPNGWPPGIRQGWGQTGGHNSHANCPWVKSKGFNFKQEATGNQKRASAEENHIKVYVLGKSFQKSWVRWKRVKLGQRGSCCGEFSERRQDLRQSVCGGMGRRKRCKIYYETESTRLTDPLKNPGIEDGRTTPRSVVWGWVDGDDKQCIVSHMSKVGASAV